MSARNSETQAAYEAWKQTYTGECTFCDSIAETASSNDKVVARYEHFIALQNSFPYDEWDHMVITKHQMLIPKRHVGSLNELNDEEALEYVTLLSKYEHDGFSIYTRSHSNASRSIPHVHTHLLTGNPL